MRLFNETKEALKQRTATSEILRVISETLGDPQPVMQAIVDTVLSVCSADSAGFFRRSGDDLILRAVSGTWRGPRPSDVVPQLPFRGDSIVVSALEEGRYQHVADTSTDPRYDAAAQWSRTRLAVPVLRGSETLGVIRVGRAAGGFSERESVVEGFRAGPIASRTRVCSTRRKRPLEQQTRGECCANGELTGDLGRCSTRLARKAARFCAAEDAASRCCAPRHDQQSLTTEYQPTLPPGWDADPFAVERRGSGVVHVAECSPKERIIRQGFARPEVGQRRSWRPLLVRRRGAIALLERK